MGSFDLDMILGILKQVDLKQLAKKFVTFDSFKKYLFDRTKKENGGLTKEQETAVLTCIKVCCAVFGVRKILPN